MDYGLAALKLFVSQLGAARPCGASAMAIGSLTFQRAWLQGVLVAGSPPLLDDGSGVIELVFSRSEDASRWKAGMYILVVGAYAIGEHHRPLLKVHKIVDLSSSPDRESCWNLEVMEAHQLFYDQPMSRPVESG